MSDGPSRPAPDEYERRFMEGEAALVRARQRMPRWVPALVVGSYAATWILSLPALHAIWRHRDDPGVGALLAFFAALFALSSAMLGLGVLLDHALRVAVTPTHLRVHRGLEAIDIPRAAITDVAVGDVRELARGLPWWGGLARRVLVVHVPGAGRCVRVGWRDAKGRARVILVTLDAADEVARALAGDDAATGVRVVEDDDEVTGAEGAEARDEARRARG